MKHMFTPGRLPAVALATLAAIVAVGCASPGPPMPPSLHLPKVVNNLSAQRIGDKVELRWQMPSRTTDGIDIKGTVAAEICRELRPALSPPNQHPDCTPVKRISVHSGDAVATTDALPAALATGPATLLIYRVSLLNATGRTAGPSSPAFAAAGVAPPPVEQLRASSARSGIVLEWKPDAVVFPVELDRTLLNAPQKTTKPASATSKAPHSSNLAPATPAMVRLQAANQSSDTGGTLDRTAQRNATYRYTAQRVRSIVLTGHMLELRSAASAPVTIKLLDVFPPAAPTGLAAIPGDHSIDLSWEPVSDADLAGYNVYRQLPAADGTASGSFTRITRKPVTGPAFSDRTAAPGYSYTYRVTSIDTSGNESTPSATVQETLPEP